MKKKLLMICFGCFVTMHIFSQSLFTYGTNEVSKDEFMRAYNRNISHVDNKAPSLKEYVDLYSKYKLKVTAAKELKLDTAEQLKYDMMNFRTRLENDYMIDVKEILVKINYKKNPAVQDEMLFLYADSAAYSKDNHKCPIAKEVIFSVAGTPVKVSEWLSFAKDYKLNKNLYKGETNKTLLEQFVNETVTTYYRKHLEEYNPDFKYQLQEFKEGNLFFEVMEKKVWNKSTNDPSVLKEYYNANKEHFLWVQSADVILVNAKSYAYADYASENMKNGQYWKNIAEGSEGMIQGDSSRYEISQLPVKPGTPLVEGAITGIVKNEADNSASFIKVIKIYPAKLQRNFDEAKSLVINEYQKQLEESWMNELVKKYPVKVNNAVLQSLLK